MTLNENLSLPGLTRMCNEVTVVNRQVILKRKIGSSAAAQNGDDMTCSSIADGDGLASKKVAPSTCGKI